jgi:hypothetical protein
VQQEVRVVLDTHGRANSRKVAVDKTGFEIEVDWQTINS